MAIATRNGAKGASKGGIRAALNDKSVRGVIAQVLVIGVILMVAAYLVSNTLTNLEERNIRTGYDFLSEEAGFEIAESLIPYSAADSYGRAILVGFFNTASVSLWGIGLASLIGLLVGIGRLSSNWLLARIAAVYVYLHCNVPVLLQIIFWHTVITYSLPHPREAATAIDGVFLSQRGLYVPAPVAAPGWTAALAAIPVALAAIWLLRRWAAARQMATGKPFPLVWGSVGLLLGLPAAAWALFGTPTAFDVPSLQGFNIGGGVRLSPEFLAVLLGLTIYTSAFIAEIVRSGILAVSKGQWEAGRALGLREGVVMGQIILPQALRIIVPPTTNQYLNVIKNSSLAVAVGYPDLVNTANTTMNQTGQAIEAISIMMLVYLTTSLATSSFMNWYNRRIQLVER